MDIFGRYIDTYGYSNYDRSKSLLGIAAAAQSQQQTNAPNHRPLPGQGQGLGNALPGQVQMNQHNVLASHHAASVSNLGQSHHSAQNHLRVHHEQHEPVNRRPRLYIDSKAPLYQPLRIETQDVEIKKEPAYTPQVEAISPTLPNEETRQDSPLKASKEYLLTNLSKLDREIQQAESQIAKLRKKQRDLELSSKQATDVQENVEVPIDTRQLGIAQVIYSENRRKAHISHDSMTKISGLGSNFGEALPLYNMPSDTAVYHENQRNYAKFKSKLISVLKNRNQEKQVREKCLSESYNQLMKDWLKRLEKKDCNTGRKAKDNKLREFFEKQFPELKKQREDKERLSRAGQRIRSDADLDDIMDGIQEQELEDKKMRSYAVIPPILIDQRHRKYKFINSNGLCDDPLNEYKEYKQMIIWTDQDKEIFREKYLLHPKNFGLISTYLERKQVSDCVQYYYQSKKSENYKQLLRKHVKKRTRALVKAQQAAAQAQQQQPAAGSTKQAAEMSKPSNTNLSGSTLVSDANGSATNLDGNPIDNAANSVINSASGEALAALGPLNCCICDTTIESLSESRLVTKSNCETFNIDPSNVTVKTRICQTCNMKFAQPLCPVPSCKTTGRKVKRLRSLPHQWHDLNPELKRAYSEELNFPLDIQKCCFRCVMRVSRRIGVVSPSFSRLRKPASVAWKDDEIEAFKRALKETGKNWTAIAGAISSKSIKECRTFYYNYKYKYKLDQLIRLYHDRFDQPKVVSDTDSDEYWNEVSDRDSEETSSADEGNGKCNSDTASASSPPNKTTGPEDMKASANSVNAATSIGSGPGDVPMGRLQDLRALSASQASLKSDYDSSATMSADEGHGDAERRSASPSIHKSQNAAFINPLYTQHQADRHARPNNSEEQFSERGNMPKPPPALVNTIVPSRPVEGLLAQSHRIPSFLINPNAPSTANSLNRDHAPPPHGPPVSKEEPTCVRDLIYQAIEMSLQTTPAKHKHEEHLLHPAAPMPERGRERLPYPVEVKSEPGTDLRKTVLSSPGHMNRQDGHGPMSYPRQITLQHGDMGNEVQDLSKKPSRSESPRTSIPTRKDPALYMNSRDYAQHSSMAPPPAHSKQQQRSDTQQSDIILQTRNDASKNQRQMYAGNDRNLLVNPGLQPRPRMAIPSSKPHVVPPPPPLIATGGSITQGTPVLLAVSQPQPVVSNFAPPRFEGLLRQLPSSGKDGGSITLGTPVHPEALRKKMELAGKEQHMGKGGSTVIYDPVSDQYFKQVPTNAAGIPLSNYNHPGFIRPHLSPQMQQQQQQQSYNAYNERAVPNHVPKNNYPPEPQHMTASQIMIDFNTSKQMQTRRGSISERDGRPQSPASQMTPRGRDAGSPYANPLASRQGMSNHYPGHPPGHQQQQPQYKQIDQRYMGPPSDPNQQADRQSPSVNWSKANVNSPNYQMTRQNVIQQWGKQSVIQAPKPISPRNDHHADRQSPAQHGSKTYTPPYYPQTHDAFQTLVNAAAAQHSIAVPQKEGDRRNMPPLRGQHEQSSRMPVKDMRQSEMFDRSYAEAQQRQRQLAENAQRMEVRDSRIMMHHEDRRFMESEREREREMREQFEREQRVRQMFSTGIPSEELRKRVEQSNERRIDINERQAQEYQHFVGQRAMPRGDPMKEQFERQQNELQRRTSDLTRKTLEEARDAQLQEHFSRMSRQQLADNEASRIFSQSFQKDIPVSRPAVTNRSGFTAASLIDAIITRQINQSDEVAPPPPNRQQATVQGVRSVVHEPVAREKQSSERKENSYVVADYRHVKEAHAPREHGNTVDDRQEAMNAQNLTLGEHIATIISKNYSEEDKSEPPVRAPQQSPSAGAHMNAEDLSGHSATNWKLRKALQQETIDNEMNLSSGKSTPNGARQRDQPGHGLAVEPISPPSSSSTHETVVQARMTPYVNVSMANSAIPSSTASMRHPVTQSNVAISPLDYVKNRIVEVMRTTSDEATSRDSGPEPMERRSAEVSNLSRPSSRDSNPSRLQIASSSNSPMPASPHVTSENARVPSRGNEVTTDSLRSMSPSEIPRKKPRMSQDTSEHSSRPSSRHQEHVTGPAQSVNGHTSSDRPASEANHSVNSPSSPAGMIIDESCAATPGSNDYVHNGD
ncbi:Nuclear receptor corepressor 1 [Halotydeus destructor]|nr:Nuclear receptor corepressor 1 [Halotydeus destructor]